MALNFGDVLLNVTAGVAEKDMADMKEERNANFNLALEEFKDNKALINKLAENRYARDVKRYDKEFEKFDVIGIFPSSQDVGSSLNAEQFGLCITNGSSFSIPFNPPQLQPSTSSNV